MVNRFFTQKIKENFPFQPTNDQNFALEKIAEFLFSNQRDLIFVLKGYAGTGKSSLIGSLVKTMTSFKQKSVLMAPTGRAAKVFSRYANQSAYTIHKKIYRQNKQGVDSSFSLNNNLHTHTLFIVDEASMISNDPGEFSIFGSGRLLDDLIEYVYTGEGCRLMLVGDTAQLPPVKQENSPALDNTILRSYFLQVNDFTLTEIVRQEHESGILKNATMLRNALIKQSTHDFPQLQTIGFPDIKRITGAELIDELSDAYRRDGMEETIVISRSNKRVNAYNSGIRNSVLDRDEELNGGDLMMVTKNNYFWVDNFENLDFLANGEFVEVKRVRGEQEMYGFRFCNALLYHADYDVEFEAKILLNVLHSETSGLSHTENERFFAAVMEDYVDIGNKRERYKEIKKNPYFNALQLKYGYAVTCHKAQGGEWKNVFLDVGYVNKSYMNEGFYRWLYTAITRCSGKLYLVNLSKDFGVE